MGNATVIEELDVSSFDKKATVQVLLSDAEPLYISCTSRDECSTWLQVLRKAASLSNAVTPRSCHSGIFKKGWTCCKAKSAEAAPCSKAHGTIQEDPLDVTSPPQEIAHQVRSQTNRGLC